MKFVLLVILTVSISTSSATELGDAKRAIGVNKERLRRATEVYSYQRQRHLTPYLRAHLNWRHFDDADKALGAIIDSYFTIGEKGKDPTAHAKVRLLEERRRVWFADGQRWLLRVRNLSPERRDMESILITELKDLDGKPLTSARFHYREGIFNPLTEIKIIERACDYLLDPKGASGRLPSSARGRRSP